MGTCTSVHNTDEQEKYKKEKKKMKRMRCESAYIKADIWKDYAAPPGPYKTSTRKSIWECLLI